MEDIDIIIEKHIINESPEMKAALSGLVDVLATQAGKAKDAASGVARDAGEKAKQLGIDAKDFVVLKKAIVKIKADKTTRGLIKELGEFSNYEIGRKTAKLKQIYAELERICTDAELEQFDKIKKAIKRS